MHRNPHKKTNPGVSFIYSGLFTVFFLQQVVSVVCRAWVLFAICESTQLDLLDFAMKQQFHMLA